MLGIFTDIISILRTTPWGRFHRSLVLSEVTEIQRNDGSQGHTARTKMQKTGTVPPMPAPKTSGSAATDSAASGQSFFQTLHASTPHPKVWYQRSSTNFQLPADVYVPFPPSARSDRNLHFNLQGGILPWFLCSSLAPSQVDHVPAILARKRSWFVLRARWLRGNRALKAFCVAYLPASEALESFNWPQTRRSQGQWHFTGESFFQEKGEPRVMVFKP